MGLGLKYCIKYPRPTNRVSQTVEQLKNDVRRTYYFKYFPPPDDDPHNTKYTPELYLSAEWKALIISDKRIENALSLFKSTVSKARVQYYKNNPANLQPS